MGGTTDDGRQMPTSGRGDDADPGPVGNVLIVDDEAAIRRLLVRGLGSRGFSTLEAADGATALKVVASEDVDVVLLDNGLPDISGLEVLARLRAQPATATLPVILVTGQSDLADRIDGLGAGADDYIVKPVELSELVARVHAQLRGRNAWRSQVEDALRHRAVLARAIAAIPSLERADVVAQQVTDQLAQLAGVRRVAVIEFGLDAGGSVIGLTGAGGEDAVAGEALPLAALAEIRQVVAGQSFSGVGHAELLPHTTSAAVLSDVEGDVLAVPIGGSGRTVGVLLLEAGAASTATRAELRNVEAAVIDLLPLIEMAVGSTLDARHGADALSRQIAQVIAERGFRPVYQPIYELESNRMMGFEALTRFVDGAAPDRRFVEATQAGMGADLELATLEMTLGTSVALPVGCYVSVNVSAAMLIENDIGPLLELAEDRPVVLEVTEHERIDDYAAVRAAIDRLPRDVRLSVDDAGSGWASLRHVFALSPDFVKLDRGWVSDIETDPARQALLLGITQFASLNEGVVVAEGIETHRELSTLRELGIPFGQGYLLGRPAPVDDFSS